MGLKPLEFSDCYRDSPYFREYVYEHEKELEKTNERIKGLTKECKNLLRAVDSELFRSFCLLVLQLLSDCVAFQIFGLLT